jgi:membrane protease subunit (stomatin/prohibitin family)
MSLWNRLTGEFVDVIEWTDDSRDTVVWRFERYGNEIKYGAKLTVREGQAAVFVHEGVLADVFQPGLYMLETNNMPVMTTLQHWDHGFQSPFKSEIYFVSTRRFQDLKWGTKNPIIMRDPEFGMVRVRAFGTYSIRVADPALFMSEIVGTDGEFTTDEITFQIRNVLVSRFSNALAKSGIAMLDMAGHTDELAELLRKRIAPELAAYGLETPALYIENISMPKEVEEALDKRTAMGVVGDLGKYAQYQAPRPSARRRRRRARAWARRWAWAWAPEWAPIWARSSAARWRGPGAPRRRARSRRRPRRLPRRSGTSPRAGRPRGRSAAPIWAAWPARAR